MFVRFKYTTKRPLHAPEGPLHVPLIIVCTHSRIAHAVDCAHLTPGSRRAQVRRPPWWGDANGAVADARPWSAGARVLHPRTPPPPAGVAGHAGHGAIGRLEAEQRALADEYAEEVRQRKAASQAATSVQAISRGNRARAKSG